MATPYTKAQLELLAQQKHLSDVPTALQIRAARAYLKACRLSGDTPDPELVEAASWPYEEAAKGGRLVGTRA